MIEEEIIRNEEQLSDEDERLQDDEIELFENFRFVVDKGQSPFRIDKYLAQSIQNISRNKIQLAADADCILVNDKPVKSNYKIKPNDIIVVLMTKPPKSIEVIPENIPLNVVYEDEHLVVVNKDPGMVVHPSFGHYSGTLINALAYLFKDLPLFQSGDMRPGLVHRIDKDTSGILVVAKNEIAKTKLGKQFFDRVSERRYVALVWGNFDDDQGTITGNIGRNPRNRKLMYVFQEEEMGKHAVTHYKVLERFGYVTLIECKLETGRTHQIRIHMQYIGHPLFNDAEYGGDHILKGTTFTKYKQFVANCFKTCPRQALHAKSLGFYHPNTNEFVSFDSEIPADMTALLDKWRNYIANRKEFDCE